MALDYYVINTNQSGNYGTSAKCPNLEARAYWSVCQPTSSTFYWDNIHAALDAAAITGGKVGLLMYTGSQTPSWVMSHVFQTVTDSNSVVYPAPWGTNYKSYWEDFVTAIYNEFGDNAFDHIVCTRFCTKSPNCSLDGLPGVTLTDWQNAGYTATKAYNSFTESVDFVRSLFTATTVAAAWGPVGAGLGFDTVNGAVTIESMENYYEGLSGNIADMNEAVSDQWYRPFPTAMKVIYQEAQQQTSQTQFNNMVTNATNGHASQLQLYKQDVHFIQ